MNKKVVSGSIQPKKNLWYMVFKYRDNENNLKVIWRSTKFKVKGEKKKATELLIQKKSELQYLVDNNLYEEISIFCKKTEYGKNNINLKVKFDNISDNNTTNEINDKSVMMSEKLLYHYMEYWLYNIAKSKFKELSTTYMTYDQLIHCKIKEYFLDNEENRIRLKELKASHIQNFVNFLSEKNLASSTIVNYFNLISETLEHATKMEYIVKNVTKNVDINKSRSSDFKPTFFSRNELDVLFDIVKDSRIYEIVLMTAIYGFRRSEVLGLKWDAIDFTNKSITISHTVVYAKENGERKLVFRDKAKTKSSLRTLPLIPVVENLLLELRNKQMQNMNLFKDNYNMKFVEYVFVDELGNFITPDYLTKTFIRKIKKSKLRHIRFHDLRHTCASLLLKDNVHMKNIQEWLGHSNFSTTANIYSHLDKGSKQIPASKLSETFDINNDKDNDKKNIDYIINFDIHSIFNDSLKTGHITKDDLLLLLAEGKKLLELK